MKKYIKKIREKPEHARKRILLLCMIVSMSVIFLFWFHSLGNRFNNNIIEETKEDLKPFKLLSSSLSGVVEEISNEIN